MSKIINGTDGRPFAMLIETDTGSYLVPPIVLDRDLNVIEGLEVMAAMHLVGVEIESTDGGVWRGITPDGAEVVQPVLTGMTAADLARIDQDMATISSELGVPIGPPGLAEETT